MIIIKWKTNYIYDKLDENEKLKSVTSTISYRAGMKHSKYS